MNKKALIGVILMFSPLFLIFYASQPGTPLSILPSGTGYVNEPYKFRWVVDTNAGVAQGFGCPTNYPNFRADIIMFKPGDTTYGTPVATSLVPSGISFNGWSYLVDYSFTPNVVGTYTIRFIGKCWNSQHSDYVYAGREEKTFEIKQTTQDSSTGTTDTGTTDTSSGSTSTGTTTTQECSSGATEKTCAGDNAVTKTCDSTGQWVTITQYCQYGCSAGECITPPPVQETTIDEGQNISTNETIVGVNETTSIDLTVNQEIKENPKTVAEFSVRLWLEKEDLMKGVKNITIIISMVSMLAGLYLFIRNR